MHMNAKRPVFVPFEYQAEMEKLSKSALMDMVWDYARQYSGHLEDRSDAVMDEFRYRREIILAHRSQVR